METSGDGSDVQPQSTLRVDSTGGSSAVPQSPQATAPADHPAQANGASQLVAGALAALPILAALL
ncbi:hypothetical protein B0I72DRAFT_149362 [Yarrowia lipolytica]|uniref:Uncharacterized protein n=1 Tax=Yarrowia lipolytica TaxID=4952 RepID=A0A371BXN4_YARLL|nr:hypothetical protein BKA91DRAFT_148397 [Yarrowia lipolytica]KAE8169814.1 hypothetical protein BKA90DRAFT_149025 [Yarrowia lipolytica]RDW22851.1 hypothetical protein B0I71DRAFT_155787 [Yarrowia lipolytica]RDW29607.1 hypothetical protein B0I72DRAFT_149362 [Yarrowia lipolytica]RDW39111.1 hypothetical protein B0I73DRAFT_147601 [Yarrowia lipolytica]